MSNESPPQRAAPGRSGTSQRTGTKALDS
jgi:hypothetical protein